MKKVVFIHMLRKLLCHFGFQFSLSKTFAVFSTDVIDRVMEFLHSIRHN
jgi:pantothenate kinase